MSLEASVELRDQLLTGGILSPAQVTQAEQRAQADATDLQSILLREKVLTENQLQALRAARFGVPYCDLSDFVPRLQNSELLPEAMARGHVMFPLFDIDEIITLVMEDPQDLSGIDQARRQTRREVEVCAGGRGEILGLIERAYGASNYLEESAAGSSLTSS